MEEVRCHKRCKNCGINLIFIVSNLYNCKKCGFVILEDNKNIPLTETDLRRYIFKWDVGMQSIVYSVIYQIDLLKLMIVCKRVSPYHYEKFKSFIKQVDKIDNTETDFGRMKNLPRIFLSDFLD